MWKLGTLRLFAGDAPIRTMTEEERDFLRLQLAAACVECDDPGP